MAETFTIGNVKQSAKLLKYDMEYQIEEELTLNSFINRFKVIITVTAYLSSSTDNLIDIRRDIIKTDSLIHRLQRQISVAVCIAVRKNSSEIRLVAKEKLVSNKKEHISP